MSVSVTQRFVNFLILSLIIGAAAFCSLACFEIGDTLCELSGRILSTATGRLANSGFIYKGRKTFFPTGEFFQVSIM